jgi:hypothetical protein
MNDLTETGLTQTELIAVIVGVVLLVALIAFLIVRARSARQRRARLSERFGPEYDRTVDAVSKRRDAERDLQARLDRHPDIATHPIEAGAAREFEQRLDDLQARFVDAPAAAVVAADGVLADIAVAAGYPDGPTDRLLGDISVDHPVAVADHRRGQEVAQRSGRKSPSTEELRTALVAARHLCEALLAPSMADRTDTGGHGTRSADVPPTDAPRADASSTDASRADVPSTDAPRGDVPRADAGRADTSPTDAPRGDVPPTDAPRADASPTDAATVDAQPTEAPPLAPPPPAPAPEPSAGGRGADRRDTPPAAAPDTDDGVIELPEHERVGPSDRHTGSDGQPGEGLLGPDGRPVH